MRYFKSDSGDLRRYNDNVRSEFLESKIRSLNLTEISKKEYDSEINKNKKSLNNKSKEEYFWARLALSNSDIEVTYHTEGSSRAKATLQDWYDYRESLRNYATVKDGVYSYKGKRPVPPK